MGERGVFPGTFDPLTVGHLAVADAAHAELGLATIELVISHDPLAKQATTSVEERIAAVARHRARRPWLRARSTVARLLADIAEGYDVLILGADKWHQLHDVGFYGSTAARDDALARLPRVAVAPRAGTALPEGADVHILSVPAEAHEVSSTAVRSGREEWRA